MSLLQKIKTNFSNNKLRNKKLLIAVSGGRDSICLLHALLEIQKEFEFELAVCHLNHGLRDQNSDLDEKFVSKLANKLKLEFFSTKIDLSHKSTAIEESARKARYEFFQQVKITNNFDFITTAHHLNDSVETVLMNLIRGCGLRGLLGIDFKNGDLIRPFFNACEDEISAFVNSQAIEFRVDESNFSDDFLRNRIRKKLLKKKSDENSQISFFTKNFSKFQKEFSDLFAQSRNFSKKWLKSNSSFEKGFPCDEFAKLSDWQKSELLTYIYELKYASTTNLSSAQIAKWIELIEKKSSGKHKELGSKFYLSVDFGFFHLIEKNFHEASLPKTPQLLKLGINKFGFCEIKVSTNSEGAGQGIYLPKSLFAEGVYVRSFQSGDKITFQNRRITKKLSDFFAETKIPLHTRSKIPIFTNKKGEILAVGNLWTRENLLQNKQNKNTLCTGSTQKTGDAKCWTEEKPQPYCEHTVRIFSKEAQAGRFFQCFLNENSISNKR